MNDGKERRVGWVMRGLMCALLAVGGCKVGPDYKRPETKMPGEWAEGVVGGPTTQPAAVVEWWKTFNDPVLDELVKKAVESNYDLKIATSRIREARALRRIVAADQLPSVNGSGSYRRAKGSENIGFQDIGALSVPGTPTVPGGGTGGTAGLAFNPAIITEERSLWQVGFDANWELDVFGGIKRSVEAADAEVGAAVEARRDVMVSLAAEVAANYMDLRGIQKQIEITKANIKSQQDTVELTRTRFNAGLTGELDVVRAESQVATTSATLPSLEAATRRSIHRMGVLTGQWPGTLSAELSKEAKLPATQPAVPVGLPSDLLRRRADIRQAERQLAAATARIGVATADLYPKFNLMGGIGLQSDKAKTLFNSSSNYWSIGPGVTLPIFDRGRIRARIEVQDARTEQAMDTYEGTVLRALEEVEDALVGYTQEQRRMQSLAEAVRANRRAVELANELYSRGLAPFLNVLDAQRALYLSEEQLVLSERAVATDLVALYKALGGGWEEQEGSGDRGQGSAKEAEQQK